MDKSLIKLISKNTLNLRGPANTAVVAGVSVESATTHTLVHMLMSTFDETGMPHMHRKSEFVYLIIWSCDRDTHIIKVEREIIVYMNIIFIMTLCVSVCMRLCVIV